MKVELFGAILMSLLILGCNRTPDPTVQSSKKEYIALTSDKFDAVEMNNQVSSIQKGAVAIVDSVFRADTLSISKKLNDAIFELDVSIKRLQSLGEENQMVDYFSNSVVDLLYFYKNEFETEFKALMPILKRKILSQEDKEILSQYDLTFVKLEAQLFEEILVRQDSFASYYKIGLSN